MPFENPQLEIAHLPAYQESDYVPLELAYRKVIHRVSAFFVLLLLVGPVLLYFIHDNPDSASYPWVVYGSMGLWFLISALIMGVVGPAFRQKGYAIRERDISYQTGLIHRKTTTIPFNRVQHCDIKQGPITRYFGLSKLNVYTAGGAKSDLSIPGLTLDTAQQLMDFVLQKTLAYDEEE